VLRITGMRSWNINADNLDQMVHFYCDILGAEETRRHNVGDALVARLRLAGLGIGVFDAASGPRPGVPHHTLEFEGSSEMEATIRELESQGVEVEETRVHGEGPGYSLYVTDPSGNRLELSTDPS
jgi:catechol 2,3-dioxygenase-like lactoylglutathione lyase family enzyme